LDLQELKVACDSSSVMSEDKKEIEHVPLDIRRLLISQFQLFGNKIGQKA